jgi:hypothetical protein
MFPSREDLREYYHQMLRMSEEFFPVAMVKSPLVTDEHIQIPDTSPTLLHLGVYWKDSRFKFAWSRETLGKSNEVIAAAIFTHFYLSTTSMIDYPPVSDTAPLFSMYSAVSKKSGKKVWMPLHPHLGFFSIAYPERQEELHFLYIDDVWLCRVADRFIEPEKGMRKWRTTLYQRFQRFYSAIVDPVPENDDYIAGLFGFQYERHRPKRFSTLAKKALTRQRKVDTRTRYRILMRDNSTCQVCGRSVPEVKLEVDHIIPPHKGGSNEDDNLQALCEDCNKGKSDWIFKPLEK